MNTTTTTSTSAAAAAAAAATATSTTATAAAAAAALPAANAIGMLEFNSIVKGIEVCDIMLKAANVTPLRCCSVCPGKYIALIAGDTGSMNAAMDAGERAGGEFIVDMLRIPKAHAQLIPAISGTAAVTRGDAVGGLEYFSVASAVLAADEAPKAASVSLIDVKIGYAVGGKGVVLFTGDTGAVQKALEAAKNRTSDAGLLVYSTFINHPSEDLYLSLL